MPIKKKSKFSPQSKSFTILFIIAVLGTYICLILAKVSNFPGALTAVDRLGLQNNNQNQFTQQAYAANPYLPKDSPLKLDTADWKTYADAIYNFNFKYQQKWKIKNSSMSHG